MGSSDLLMTVEVHFAQKLADNNKTIRDRAVKRLRKWLVARTESKNDFTEDEMLKIWKGLFYCMWMSDKPLFQEELALTISELMHSLKTTESLLKYIEIFFTTMIREWYGIDGLRLNKFMMFVRTFIRVCFQLLQKRKWNKHLLDKVLDIFTKSILNKTASDNVPLSLQLHLSDVYVEEYAKVTKDLASPEVGGKILEPYCKLLVETKVHELRKNIQYKVFYYIIKISNVGLPEIKDKPTPEPEDEEEVIEKLPKSKPHKRSYGTMIKRQEKKAIQVPFLHFNYSQLSERFKELAKRPSKGRSIALNLSQKFKLLSEGVYPLVMELPDIGAALDESDIEDAVNKLDEEFGPDPNKKRRRRPNSRRKKKPKF